MSSVIIQGKLAEKCNKVECIHRQLDLSEYICPVCDSHLATNEICLNGCHLGERGKERFQQFMERTFGRGKPNE